jgi:thiol-disulfide isomerase/thioredoxin
VNFTYAPNLTTQNVQIELYDGMKQHLLKLGQKSSWSGKLYAPYSLVIIALKDGNNKLDICKVFISRGKSFIHLVSTINTLKINFDSSKNLIPYESLGGDKYDKVIGPLIDDMHNYYMKHQYELDQSKIAELTKMDSHRLRMIAEFIRNNPANYMSYWAYQVSILTTKTISDDSLQIYYDNYLPDKYKKMEEGFYLKTLIANKLATNIGAAFPEFELIDIQNNPIKSSALRGNYILLQFWASWCIPCLLELPKLAQLNQQYKGAKLKIISYSIDADSVKFQKAVQKNAINWTVIYGDDVLFKKMLHYPIPQVYLIDPNGKTIYNSTKINDPDLVLLQAMLEKLIK